MTETAKRDQADVDTGLTFTLDGREVTATKGELIIAAAERAGTYIPRFCYHPRMDPVGMCRMCLVDVEGPRGATLTPACFVAVTDGMVVDTTNERVKKAQDGVLEFLLANHPLDCPVCDKGGECPLQDQTLAYGPGESRFIEEKRHFEKPIAISDLVLLDRERCIQCARCTRFADEVAGEAQIDFAGRGEAVEVATFPTEPFESYFSGNTVQICPVGALTATPYRFTARPWDLDQVESTCTACSVGCRVAVQSSQNRLTRLLGIDSEPVNHGWLCDKGRFAYESVNGDEVDAAPLPTELADEAVDVAPATASQVVSLGVNRGQFLGEVRETGRFEHGRLVEPRLRKAGELVPVSWGEALTAAADGIRGATKAGGPGAVAVIGGARLTNESAYAWAKLAKGIIGTDSVDAQLGDGLPAELVLGLPRATIDRACAAPVVITLAGDLREELPVLFLRLRAGVKAGTTELVEIAPAPTALSPLAAATLRIRPGDAPSMARALTGDGESARALTTHHEGAAVAPGALEDARRVLADHPGGEGVVVVAGRPSLRRVGRGGGRGAAHPRGGAAQGDVPPRAPARQRVRRARHGAGSGHPARPGQPRCGTGSLHQGLGIGARRDRPRLRRDPGLHGRRGRRERRHERGREPEPGAGIRALILLGADPLSDFPDHAVAEQALSAGHFVVAVTGHPSQSVDAHADVVLPCAVAHERAGTTTNIEGRVSRLGPKLTAPGFAWPDWMIAAELAASLGADLGVRNLSELADELEGTAQAYAGLTQEVLNSDAAHDGIVVPLGPEDHHPDVSPIDPIALPGVESVERQGAPPRVGTGGMTPRWRVPPLWGARRPCWRGPVPAAPSPARSPRPTTTRCAWWPDAGSTTPAAPSPVRRRSPRSCPRSWRGPTPTTSIAWARQPATA